MMKKLFSAPFIFFILAGTLIPMGVVAYYGLTDRSGIFTLENILAVFSGDHLKALMLSLLLSLTATLLCLIMAFPLALILRDSKIGKKGFMIFIFILPMWMNFVLRTMAWQVLLEKNGMLGFLGIINTPVAVVLGMVYDYLPFMVLPVYNAMVRIDDSLI
ncbi:MAG: ABC transporter permease, partial [Firmicutes bacterium]|nr:ABC transporter permease [Bacillota bacterium]